MSELSRQQRDRLPASAFALPDERRFPIHNEAHARNALARVSQFGTPAEKKVVRAAVVKRYPHFAGSPKQSEKPFDAASDAGGSRHYRPPTTPVEKINRGMKNYGKPRKRFGDKSK